MLFSLEATCAAKSESDMAQPALYRLVDLWLAGCYSYNSVMSPSSSSPSPPHLAGTFASPAERAHHNGAFGFVSPAASLPKQGTCMRRAGDVHAPANCG